MANTPSSPKGSPVWTPPPKPASRSAKPVGAPADQPTPGLPKRYLSTCVLLLLGEHRAHGYDLLARLPEVGLTRPQRDGRYGDSGALYRTLHRLEREGLVCSADEGSSGAAARRIYDLTPAGREELHRRAHGMTETSDWLGAFASRYGSPVASGVSSSRLPAFLAQTVRRRPLRGLNPLRRKSDPDDSRSRRRPDHA